MDNLKIMGMVHMGAQEILTQHLICVKCPLLRNSSLNVDGHCVFI